ncbi:hypothetical protein FGG08_002279 [Glutinoglossum americanum]|uniref:Secreted protein n=1 Tax=Glutinoglossum americanum TaxID=1670608 RepID=A0A9P8IBZ2_9PEZI|nr:hypothetical protein FGG08_002279 [Glutinoglossum americanum]
MFAYLLIVAFLSWGFASALPSPGPHAAPVVDIVERAPVVARSADAPSIPELMATVQRDSAAIAAAIQDPELLATVERDSAAIVAALKGTVQRRDPPTNACTVM